MEANSNGGQVLNLSGKSVPRESVRASQGNSNGDRLKSSGSTNLLNKNQHFDLLSAYGNDVNAAMAAVQAAAASNGGIDIATAAANLNAIAHLNQLAANPKLAAMFQLQQQQLINPTGIMPLAPPSSSTGQNSMAQSGSSSSLSQIPGAASLSAASSSMNKSNHTRYQQLLSVIDEMGKDLRTTYMGNKNSIERLKRGITSAKILVKDCQMECERNTK